MSDSQTLDRPMDAQPTGAQATDWHPADVLAALKKKGNSLAALSVAHGYHPTAAGKALKRRWPALEVLIADAIGVPAAQIWPSRYGPDGQPTGRAGQAKA